MSETGTTFAPEAGPSGVGLPLACPVPKRHFRGSAFRGVTFRGVTFRGLVSAVPGGIFAATSIVDLRFHPLKKRGLPIGCWRFHRHSFPRFLCVWLRADAFLSLTQTAAQADPDGYGYCAQKSAEKYATS